MECHFEKNKLINCYNIKYVFLIKQNGGLKRVVDGCLTIIIMWMLSVCNMIMVFWFLSDNHIMSYNRKKWYFPFLLYFYDFSYQSIYISVCVFYCLYCILCLDRIYIVSYSCVAYFLYVFFIYSSNWLSIYLNMFKTLNISKIIC